MVAHVVVTTIDRTVHKLSNGSHHCRIAFQDHIVIKLALQFIAVYRDGSIPSTVSSRGCSMILHCFYSTILFDEVYDGFEHR